MRVEYLRQLGWFDPTKSKVDGTVVGCGGIGSFSALALAKLGVISLTLIDPDRVESHNVPNQFYGTADIGFTKVDALSRHLFSLTGVQSTNQRAVKFPEKTYDKLNTPLVVSAVDSMKSRKEIWDAGVRRNPAVKLFIDGRLGGESIRIISMADVVSTKAVERYEKTITKDEDTAHLDCTRQQIIYVGFVIAAIVSRIVARHFTDKKVPFESVCDLSKTLHFMEIQ